ncbi:VanZ family protein [Hyphococcus sp. DH-69]|uniref:VanZ family protein n=1 Tax=Hyphococcus formosus TaxID=3143534 RepID=UPI00398A5ECA
MMTARRWARVLFVCLFIVVTFLTLTPNPDDTEAGFAFTRLLASALFGNAAFADKIAHFLAYGALGTSAYWAQIELFARRWMILILLPLYGVLLEGLQGLGGVRSPEIADAVANGLGAFCGFLFGYLCVVAYSKVRAS